MNESPRNILALVPNWLGDAVMCTPALRALHRRFPEANLTVAGRAAICDVLRDLPWFSEIVPFPAHAGLVKMMRIARELRPHAGDLAVVFPHSFRAALLALLTGAKRRVGYDRGGRGLLLTDRVAPYRQNGVIQPIYMATEYVDLIKCLGCEDDGEGLELRADPAAVETAKALFKGTGPRVGFAPGAAFGPSKMWLADRYAQVADALASRVGAQCILWTGPGEEKIRDEVLAAAKTSLIQCDGAPTIKALKATISQLDLLICNDSGPRHVAIAFKVPTVCIMGPTSPRYTAGPYERGRVLQVDVDCGPCQKPECETDHRCMTQISVDLVVQTALEIIGR